MYKRAQEVHEDIYYDKPSEPKTLDCTSEYMYKLLRAVIRVYDIERHNVEGTELRGRVHPPTVDRVSTQRTPFPIQCQCDTIVA